jgi:hypothetical protein
VKAEDFKFEVRQLKDRKTLFQNQNADKRAKGIVLMVECSPGKSKGLGSILGTTKRKSKGHKEKTEKMSQKERN